MAGENSHINELILLYVRGEKMSSPQIAALDEWRSRSEAHRELPDQFRDKDWVWEEARRYEAIPKEEMWEGIMEGIGRNKRVPIWKYAAAACLILLLAGGLYIFYDPNPSSSPVQQTEAVGANHPVRAPEYRKALMSLSDGRYIVMDSIDEISYKTFRVTDRATGFDSLTTRMIHAFTLLLPNGTKVMLSHASSIRYPNSYGSGRNEVYLDGEAYFEAVYDKDIPFVVHVNGTTVRVLGTKFNIKAYAGESQQEITLVGGRVSVEGRGVPVILDSAYKQATVTRHGVKVKIITDTADIASWRGKEPYIPFHHTDLATAVQRLARFYGMKVKAKPGVNARINYDCPLYSKVDSAITIINQFEKGNALLKKVADTIVIEPFHP